MGVVDTFQIQDASDIVGEVYARTVVAGPPGSGKSYTALLLGTEIAKAIGSFVGVVETERGKSAFYSAKFPHKVIRLTSFEPENYIKAMRAFEQAGCRVIIIDSLSHAWEGTGGVRARVDQAKIRNGGNGFQAWADGTKLQNALMDAIMSYPGYVFACVRTKIEHAQVTENGRTVIKKMGADLVQRGDIEYEFDLALQFESIAHDATVTKSVLADYLPVGAMFTCPDATVAHTILRWVEETGGKREPTTTDDIEFAIQEPDPAPPPRLIRAATSARSISRSPRSASTRSSRRACLASPTTRSTDAISSQTSRSSRASSRMTRSSNWRTRTTSRIPSQMSSRARFLSPIRSRGRMRKRRPTRKCGLSARSRRRWGIPRSTSS
jgi:hypothetical protein